MLHGALQHVVLIFPMMLKVAHSNVILGEDLHGNTLFHLLLASALRYLHIQLWMTTTRFHGLIKKHKVPGRNAAVLSRRTKKSTGKSTVAYPHSTSFTFFQESVLKS